MQDSPTETPVLLAGALPRAGTSLQEALSVPFSQLVIPERARETA